MLGGRKILVLTDHGSVTKIYLRVLKGANLAKGHPGESNLR